MKIEIHYTHNSKYWYIGRLHAEATILITNHKKNIIFLMSKTALFHKKKLITNDFFF
jgi:hypothetical protein